MKSVIKGKEPESAAKFCEEAPALKKVSGYCPKHFAPEKLGAAYGGRDIYIVHLGSFSLYRQHGESRHSGISSSLMWLCIFPETILLVFY